MFHDRLTAARAHSAGAVAAWRLVKPELKGEFTANAYQMYVEPLQFLLIEDDRLVFLAHSQTQKLWLESEARRVIEQRLQAFIDLHNPIAIRTFKELSHLAQECAKDVGLDVLGAVPVRDKSATAVTLPEARANGAGPGTFDSFCVGPSNQRAVALARLIAAKTSAATQLVLFYGEPGVGKTHLAEAICNEVSARDPQRPVLMMKTLAFFEEFQNIIHNRKGDAAAFKARMREPSLLVLDDVQHLASKKVTEEEFSALLSYHLENGSQIVLTADVGPEGLLSFSDRLKHRLRCATECQIGLPDTELRRAILDSRVAFHAAAHPGFAVEPEALDMIATRMEVSGRELDGAIGQLVLEWEMANRPLTLAMTEEALRSRLAGADKRILIEHVREAAAQHFLMSQQELLRKTRERAVSYPRQVAMYAACKLTSQSLPNIAKFMGNFDHTTVLHARKKITKLLAADGNDSVRRDVEAVLKLARQIA